MSSILPTDTTLIDGAISVDTNSTSELPLIKEYAWDFDKNEFVLKDGKFVVVTGAEAVKIWAWKALHTERYHYLAYSWDFGHEFESLIGSGLPRDAIESECRRFITEALTENSYILSVTNIEISMDDSIIGADFTINTPYGEVDMNV
jgi:hypothetical protein